MHVSKGAARQELTRSVSHNVVKNKTFTGRTEWAILKSRVKVAEEKYEEEQKKKKMTQQTKANQEILE